MFHVSYITGHAISMEMAAKRKAISLRFFVVVELFLGYCVLFFTQLRNVSLKYMYKMVTWFHKFLCFICERNTRVSGGGLN